MGIFGNYFFYSIEYKGIKQTLKIRKQLLNIYYNVAHLRIGINEEIPLKMHDFFKIY